MTDGWNKSKWMRDNSTFIASEIAGKWFGKHNERGTRGWEDWRPRNLLDRLTMTYLAFICPQTIKARIKPKVFGMQGQAKLREYDLNHCIEEVELPRKHEMCVLDTLISGRGWMEVGLTAGVRVAEIRGERQDIGYEYVRPISWDDRVTDPWSRDPEEDAMRCARRLVSRAWLEEVREFAQGDTAAMIDRMLLLNNVRQSGGEEATATLIEGDGTTNAGCFDQIEMWRVVFYQGDRVYEGLAPHWNAGNEWIVEPSEFQGPEGGPFIDMVFTRLPNGRTPIAHYAQVLDLHLAQAELSAKLTDDVLESKTVGVYKDEEGRQLAMDLRSKHTDHQGFVKGDPSKLAKFTMGEHIPSNIEGMALIDNWTDQQTASLQTGGDKSGSDTATGDMILDRNAMTVMGRFKGKSMDSLRQVLRQLRWYADTNPEPRNYLHKMPGGLMVELQYDETTREGDFEDFTEDVQPWFPSAFDPALDKAQTLEMFATLNTHVLPLAMAGFPMEGLLAMTAETFNKPELLDIAPTPEAMQQAQMLMQGLQPPQPGQPGQPSGGPQAPQGGNATKTAPKPIDEQKSAMSGGVPVGAA